MGNSRSFQAPSVTNSHPNVKLAHIGNVDSLRDSTTITCDDEKMEGYRKSVSSFPITKKKQFLRGKDVKSPKGSTSFTQGFTTDNESKNQHQNNNSSRNKLPPLKTTNKQYSNPASQNNLSSIEQPSSILTLRQSYSNGSPPSPTSNLPSSLRPKEIIKTRGSTPIRTSSPQAINIIEQSPTARIQSSSSSSRTSNSMLPPQSSPPSPHSSTAGILIGSNNTTMTTSSNIFISEKSLNAVLDPVPTQSRPKGFNDSDTSSSLHPTASTIISTNGQNLISNANKRLGNKMMFDRDAINNNNVNVRFGGLDTNVSKESRQDDEHPLILSTTLDIDIMMKQKKLASISTPPRVHTPESQNVHNQSPTDRKKALKNISSAPNLINDPVSPNDKVSFGDNLIGGSLDEKATMQRMEVDDILREKPILKGLKKLKSENSIRRRSGSLGKLKKGIATENNSSKYLRENDGISSNIMNILKGCEDLLGDLELEPKCPFQIEVTQPDRTPETSHLIPLQNSRRFNLLTVPDPKQVMRESRSEQKQQERKQKSVNKEVASIIKDIRSSFSEFDF